MKRLTVLWRSLALELGQQLGVQVSRDIETVARRVDHEGFAFMSITLPSYSADFERSLEQGVIDSTSFRAFRKHGRAPAFLQGFLSRVFDTENGTILDVPDVQAVWAIRQLTLVFKKIKLECSADVTAAAFERYVECDIEVGAASERILDSDALMLEARTMFTELFWRPLKAVDAEVSEYRLEPRHGGGATADRLYGNQKWTFPTWHERFEDGNIFPYGEYALSRHGLLQTDEHDGVPVNFIPAELEPPVKVVSVPKTQTSPRIIAEEPTCMMYMQQGIMHSLVPSLEKDSLVGPMIGFTDQDPNREMARVGSITGELATLDLKEASDRVPYAVIRELIRPIAPTLWEGMDACRSRTANVNGSTHTLNKFASMGSALCFPVEAMYFLCVVFVGIRRALNGANLGRREILAYHGSVRVYGDDIIVPSIFANSVREALSDFGLVVNEGKSFHQGRFRESCGGDYFAGEFVTPVRFRALLPSSRGDVDRLVSWTDTMNQLWFAGLWATSETVRGELEAHLGPLPMVPRDSQALGLHTFSEDLLPFDRMCPRLQVPQVKAWVPRSAIPKNSIDGYTALRKCFAGDYYDSSNAGHLDASDRKSVV